METIGKLIKNVATTVSKYSNEIGNYLASKTDKKNSKLKIIGQLGMAVAMPWASKDILDSVEKIKELQLELNLKDLLVWSNFPGVKHEDAMRSIKLFNDEVIPKINQRDKNIKRAS